MWNMWNEHGFKLQHLATKVRLIKKLVRIHTKSASVPGPAVFLHQSRPGSAWMRAMSSNECALSAWTGQSTILRHWTHSESLAKPLHSRLHRRGACTLMIRTSSSEATERKNEIDRLWPSIRVLPHFRSSSIVVNVRWSFIGN